MNPKYQLWIHPPVMLRDHHGVLDPMHPGYQIGCFFRYRYRSVSVSGAVLRAPWAPWGIEKQKQRDCTYGGQYRSELHLPALPHLPFSICHHLLSSVDSVILP